MKKHFEYIVVGAGPAGMQLGYYLQKNNEDYLILERGNSAGEAFKRYPRHGTLISINKVYTGYNDHETNLRWDWNSLLSDEDDFNFKNYSKEYFPATKDIVKYFHDYAVRYDLNITYNSTVKLITKIDGSKGAGNFIVDMEGGERYYCDKLVVATGISKPWMPNVPGMELTENYADVSINKEDFANQRVLILGKGNSAFETADHLVETTALIHVASPHPVKLTWNTHFPGNLRAVNNNFLDTYQLKSQNAILDCDVVRITKENGVYQVDVAYTHAHGETETLEYDRIIVATGFKLDTSIFADNCQPKLMHNDKYPAVKSDWESENIDDLYFGGVVSQANFFKKTTTPFIHGFRYNMRTLYHIMKDKYHNQTLPGTDLAFDSEAIANEMLARINRSSALWQQFGYFRDVVDVDANNNVRYYFELPKDYVGKLYSNHAFTVSLEFGKKQNNVFEVNRQPTAAAAHESFFLHPVIRHHYSGEVIGTCHLVEDLFGEWKHAEKHVQVLQEFMARQITLINQMQEQLAESES